MKEGKWGSIKTKIKISEAIKKHRLKIVEGMAKKKNNSQDVEMLYECEEPINVEKARETKL